MAGDSDFSGCFKVVVILAVILGVFVFLFVKSGTLEMKQETYYKDAMPYQRTIYLFHWDRFTGYIKSIPGRLKRMAGYAPEPATPPATKN